MAEKLTEQQKAAVENRGGRLLVSAAAGSGKTKVLVDRLLGYLTDPVHPANIDEFLMITYTKAAASELRGKIGAKLNERVAQNPENHHLHRQLQRLYLTKISTVHAFCGDILREYAYQLDLSGDFRVADENECVEIRARVMEKLLDEAYLNRMEHEPFRAFVDTQGLGRDDRAVPEIVMQLYDAARCHLNPEKWLEHCLELVLPGDVGDAAQTVYGAYLQERLFHWVEQQMLILERCLELAREAEGLEKPAAYFEMLLGQFQNLRQSQSWDEIRANGDIDFGRLTFPRNFEDADLVEQLKNARDGVKAGLQKQMKAFGSSSQQVLADMASSALAVQGLLELVRDFGKAFDEAKRSRRILDFSDLEHRTLDLLLGKSRSGPTAAAREIGSRFREVMVDEYQDSNEVQDAIYNALTQKKNLFLVGDVKQSIYQFRLADPGIFLEKYQSFLPAEEALPGQDRKIVLSRNFRSSRGVLEGCNDVFRTCMCPEVGGLYYGADEALYEGIPHVALGTAETELCCVEVERDTYGEEAAFVTAHIQNLLAHGSVRDGDRLRRVRPEDIAILLRSPGSAGACFQRALEGAGIRCATGGGVDLLQTEEIGTLHAILQVIHNPRLDIPLVAALSSPVFAFTADDLASVRGKNKSCCFYDAICQDDSPKSQHFLSVLQKLRDAMRHYGLTRLLEQVLLETSLEALYGAMDDSRTRLANIQTFFQMAVDFEAGGNRDLGRFLEYLESMEEKGLVSPGEQSAAGCVTIMSIHKSKGLEFPVVYLCNLGREFNKESQRGNMLSHKTMGIGLSAVDTRNRLRYPTIAKRAIAAKIGQEAVSEELRVLYVAMTRAKDRLVMTYASRNLQRELTQIVQKMDMGGGQVLIEEASCPGDWVLLTALQKTEAGELFALSGNPKLTNTSGIPWKIRVVSGVQPQVDSETDTVTERLPAACLAQMRDGLSFSYEHTAATTAPSKQTATGRKGREKDEEAAEKAGNKEYHRQWRKPAFEPGAPRGKDYGNALHRVMQYIDYSACTGPQAVSAEIDRLVGQRFISPEQGKMVPPDRIAALFATELGKRLQQGNVLREFKFSILEDGTDYDPALAGEKVLLQGVVDCALLEDDSITVIDFKTDFVTEETLQAKVLGYQPQVEAYAGALQRIYQKPVKQRYLYFFHLNRFVPV